MTYGSRTPTIALDEHELRSMRRWLNQFETVSGRDIFLQRAPLDFQRPAYVIKEVDRSVQDRGRSFTAEDVDWQIEILGDDFWTMKREIAEIRQRALQSTRIPLYLWSWQSPGIWLEELPGLGSLPAGEVSVKVSSVNNEDEESLASEAATITVASGSAVRVSWTPWPRGASVAKEYRVYAGASDAETLEQTVAHPGKRLSVFTDLAALAGGGATPPTSSIFFANRYMRVEADRVSSQLMEHPQVDGVFNGYVNLRTCTESVREARPGEAPVPAIATVTTAVEVE